MKNATLFALGLLSAGVWSHDSARCQTSLSPPLSLAPPSNEAAASSAAANSVPPPTGTAKGSVPPRTAKDVPRSTAPRSATVEHTPVEFDSVAPAQVIDRSPPSAKPGLDYDGFSVGSVDDDDTSSRTTRPARSHRAQQPKLNQESDRPSEQQSVEPGEDNKLKGKLTICRGCK